MDLKKLQSRALQIRALYSKFEGKKSGRVWSAEETMLGLVGDVGDLSKLVLAKEGVRDIENLDEKLAHELADCLWCLFVLAHKYNISLEDSFLKTMDELEKKITD